MSEETTPRQVLYALVAAGFVGVVAILVVGSAVAGLGPAWWATTMATMTVVVAVWMAFRWRQTATILIVAIGLLIVWTVGTLVVV